MNFIIFLLSKSLNQTLDPTRLMYKICIIIFHIAILEFLFILILMPFSRAGILIKSNAYLALKWIKKYERGIEILKIEDVAEKREAAMRNWKEEMNKDEIFISRHPYFMTVDKNKDFRTKEELFKYKINVVKDAIDGLSNQYK